MEIFPGIPIVHPYPSIFHWLIIGVIVFMSDKSMWSVFTDQIQ